MQTLWPIAPVSIAIIPEAESTSALAMNVGGTLRGPFSWSAIHASIISCWPPAPEPKTTPTSSRLASVISNPESISACLAADTPKCMLVSLRRTAFGSIHSAALKLRTSPAAFASYRETSNFVISTRPELPRIRLSHAVCTSLPTGLTTPRPVTATRRS